MTEALTIPDNTAGLPDPMGLDSAQVAATREYWVSLGLDAAAFDRAASGEVLEEVVEPAVQVLTNLKTPTLSEAEARAMAAELMRAGMPQDQVEAALQADGYSLGDERRTEEELEFDRTFGSAPPQAYRIDYRDRTPATMDAATLADANEVITEWLTATGFPPEIGPAVVERAVDVGQRCRRMSEVERQLFKREQDFALQRMAGSEERAEELLAYAKATLERGDARFRAILETSGALDDAGVVMHLAHQGERLAGRG